MPTEEDDEITQDASVLIAQTERLLLLVPGPELAPQMSEYLKHNREHVAAVAPPRPPTFYETASIAQRFRINLDDFHAGRSVPLLLTERTGGGAIVGDCAFTNIVRGPFLACYLGYNLDREHVGQGLMFEALSAAIRYVFEDRKLHRIMANYIPTNQRSGRLLRRLGFVVEGYARDYLFLAGAWQDHVLTSLTNPSPLTP